MSGTCDLLTVCAAEDEGGISVPIPMAVCGVTLCLNSRTPLPLARLEPVSAAATCASHPCSDGYAANTDTTGTACTEGDGSVCTDDLCCTGEQSMVFGGHGRFEFDVVGCFTLCLLLLM